MTGRILRNRHAAAALALTALLALALPPGAFASSAPAPRPGKVLLLYIDGLRPDTVDDMVKQGKLPVIKDLFYDNGARLENFFTVFPSNTVISNAAFMTGRWSSETGIKSQAFFERFETRRAPWFKRIWSRKSYPRQINLLASPHEIPRLLKKNHVRTLYNWLGEAYHPSLVPINPYPAPMAWPHVAANEVNNPLLVTEEAAKRLDEVNAAYAYDYMRTDTKAKVFLVWFPSLDEAQHYDPDGQFGEVRQKLIEADEWLGRIVTDLRKREKNLYVVLFSDHGATGGKEGVYNQQYYLGRDYFYETLKMNVLGPDYSITHPGTNPGSFAYVDNMGRGQAKIYLPVKDGNSKDWSRPNTFYELTHYGLGPNREPVNLVESLAGLSLDERNKFPGKTPPFPVQFIFVKISPSLIYVRRGGGSAEALIRIHRDNGRETYQYVPVSGFSQDEDGGLHFKETWQQDPFGYLDGSNFTAPQGATPEEFLRKAHGRDEWLQATYKTPFPNAVVLVSKLLTWSPELQDLSRAQDPDIVLSATPGWNFRIESIPSADHGYIARESVRSTFMVHGPGVKTGAVETPHLILQLPPTVFEMIGHKEKPDFDEPPIQDIYTA